MDSLMTRTTLRVRGYHLDGFGHVNNARYLEFLEEGRWDYFDAHRDVTALLEGGMAFVAVNININYRLGAVLHDELEVLTSLGRVGKRSAVMHQVVNRVTDGRCVADAALTFALLDLEANQAVALEGEIRAALVSLVPEQASASQA